MLNVFTLGAGVAVAGLLPGRLALWQGPRVARAEVEAPGTVLSPAGSHRPLPSRKQLAARLPPPIGARPPGRPVRAVGTDLATRQVLFAPHSRAPFRPALRAAGVRGGGGAAAPGPPAGSPPGGGPGGGAGRAPRGGGGSPAAGGGAPAALGLPAARHARGAGRRDRPLAVRAGRAGGAA